MTQPIYPIYWQDDRVVLIDQTHLPGEFKTVAIRCSDEIAQAIKTMIVRGAPAIGIAAAYGMYFGAKELETRDLAEPQLRCGLPKADRYRDRQRFFSHLEEVAQKLRQTRPTAVNLFWAIDRQLQAVRNTSASIEQIQTILLETAQAIQAEDLQTCQAIGDNGLQVLPDRPEKLTLLTHCNAGALATAGYGTALGVIRSAWREGRLNRVYADETRPRLQGAKLTAWECVREGIPVTVITDGMAAHCMKQGLIDAVVVGADRIAANGDAANKIGTYGLAVVAKTHNVPFFVAAPLSTVDFKIERGDEIPIEERDAAEIYRVGETILCPEGAEFYNPAFDVTPAAWIEAIITEKGAVKPQELRTLS